MWAIYKLNSIGWNTIRILLCGFTIGFLLRAIYKLISIVWITNKILYCGVTFLLFKKLSWRRAQPYAVVNTAIVSIFFGGAPYGATILVRGAPKCVEAAMRTQPLGPSAPYGATILVRGVPKWPEAAMRTQPLGPSVELPVGPRKL